MPTPKAVSEEIIAATASIPTPLLLVEEKILRRNIRKIHTFDPEY